MTTVFVPFPLVAQLALIGHVASQEVVSVHHFLFGTTIGTSDLSDLNDSFWTAFQDNVLPLLSHLLVFDQMHSISLASNTAPSADKFVSSANEGGVNENPLSNNVALVISYHTALRGRSYRGRTYQGGIPITGAFSSTEVTSTFRNNLLAGYVAMFGDIFSDIGVRHVIASRIQGGSPLTTGIATNVNAYSADLALDSQRDRLEGRGA
jgi:hypothetical protein